MIIVFLPAAENFPSSCSSPKWCSISISWVLGRGKWIRLKSLKPRISSTWHELANCCTSHEVYAAYHLFCTSVVYIICEVFIPSNIRVHHIKQSNPPHARVEWTRRGGDGNKNPFGAACSVALSWPLQSWCWWGRNSPMEKKIDDLISRL